MSKISYAIKIESEVVEKIRAFCQDHGIKQGFFVEKALHEQLAREEDREDIFDFKTLKPQEKEAVSFEEYLKQGKH